MSAKINGLSCILLSSLLFVGCSLPDVCDEDGDGDGINNCEDVCPFHPDKAKVDEGKFGEEKTCTCDDADNDGVIDCMDPCPYHADIEPTECGCGIESKGSGVYLTCLSQELADQCPIDSAKTKPGACGCGISDKKVVWVNDDLTVGDKTSECPETEGFEDADLCPFDDNKKKPGVCGCGFEDGNECSPDSKVNDKCPYDDNKVAPGVCGCGQAESFADQDQDGIPDCIDPCPQNPNADLTKDYCNDYDNDGEIDNDPCPYNPNVKSRDQLNGEEYASCNLRVDSAHDKIIFEVWTGGDLIGTRTLAEDLLYYHGIEFTEEDSIDCEDAFGRLCTDSTNRCFRLDDSSAVLDAVYVCANDPVLETNLVGYVECSACSTGSESYSDCTRYGNIVFDNKPLAEPSKEKRIIVRLMNDINVYELVGDEIVFGTGKWEGINLRNVELDGNGHTIFSKNTESFVPLNEPVFANVLDSYIHDIIIDVKYQGHGLGAFAKNILRSVVEKVSVNTEMLIQESIYGGTGNKVSAGFAGYARNSEFHDIDLFISTLRILKPVDVAGFVGVGDKITATGISIRIPKVQAYVAASFAGFGLKLNGPSALTNMKMEIDHVLDINSYYGIYGDNDGDLLIKNAYLSSELIHAYMGYIGVGLGAYINGEIASGVVVDGLYLKNGSVNIEFEYYGLGVIRELKNAYVVFDNIEFEYAFYLIGKVAKLSNFMGEYGVVSAVCFNEGCSQSSGARVNLVDGEMIEDASVAVNLADNHINYNLNVSGVDNLSLMVDRYVELYGDDRMLGKISNFLIYNAKVSGIQNGSFYDDSFCSFFTNRYDESFGRKSYVDCLKENNIKEDALGVCNDVNKYLGCEAVYGCILDKLYICDYCSDDCPLDCELQTQTDVIESCYEKTSGELDAYFDTCMNSFNDNCGEYLDISNAFWYRRDETAFAFGDGDSCIETLYTPFTEAKTDEVVKTLGKGWGKKQITRRDAEGNSEKLEIPWYYPDMTWLDKMKSEMKIN